MINAHRIIEELEKIRKQPILYLEKVTPEILFSHLQSLARGVMLSTLTLSWNDFVSARQEANRTLGWENRATGTYVEMRERGIPEDEIIGKMLDVEIKMWQILDQWQTENIARQENISN